MHKMPSFRQKHMFLRKKSSKKGFLMKNNVENGKNRASTTTVTPIYDQFFKVLTQFDDVLTKLASLERVFCDKYSEPEKFVSRNIKLIQKHLYKYLVKGAKDPSTCEHNISVCASRLNELFNTYQKRLFEDNIDVILVYNSFISDFNKDISLSLQGFHYRKLLKKRNKDYYAC